MLSEGFPFSQLISTEYIIRTADVCEESVNRLRSAGRSAETPGSMVIILDSTPQCCALNQSSKQTKQEKNK